MKTVTKILIAAGAIAGLAAASSSDGGEDIDPNDIEAWAKRRSAPGRSAAIERARTGIEQRNGQSLPDSIPLEHLRVFLGQVKPVRGSETVMREFEGTPYEVSSGIEIRQRESESFMYAGSMEIPQPGIKIKSFSPSSKDLADLITAATSPIEPGDDVWDWSDSRGPLSGVGGLAIIRDGRVIAQTQTWVS